MVKRPYYGYEEEFKLLKTWEYRWWDVYFHECPKCDGRFRWQVDSSSEYRSYVIRVGTRDRYLFIQISWQSEEDS